MSFMTMTMGRWVLTVLVGTYIVLFGYSSLSHGRNFTADSVNYVDVARNLGRGRGLVQSTLGFNMPDFSADSPIPVSFTSESPLYPVSITLLSIPDIDPADAALLVAVLGYGLILLLSYLLACTLYDEAAALLAVGALLLFEPLRFAGDHAWSEPLGLSLMLLSIWLMALTLEGKLNLAAGAGLSGFVGGLAFSTRYAFGVLIVLAVVAFATVALRRRHKQDGLPGLVIFALYPAAFMLVAGPMLLHNLLTTGALLPSYNPSTIGLAGNVALALETL